jgi:UMF1 family MFS transporter
MIKMFKFKRDNPGEVLSWSFYVFANSAFATTILAVIFNHYYAEVVASGPQGTVWRIFGAQVRIPGASLFQYMVAISMLLAAVTAPILGAMADYMKHKKRYLAIFCLLGALATAFLYFIRAGDYISGGILFIVANYAFASGNIFYNALLLDISHPDDLGKISGWGWGLGYLGGGLCLALNLIMLNRFEVNHTFPAVAIWWVAFSLPILFWVKEARGADIAVRKNPVVIGFQRLRKTLNEIKRFRQLARYLVAYLFFNEGIETTIITASIFGAEEIGMEATDLVVFFLIVQGAAFIGSLMFGYLVDMIGNKRALLMAITIWSIVILWARFIGLFASPRMEFYILGILVGSVMGGSQSSARSLLASFTPMDKGGEFFGFFAVFGKFSAIFGPLIFGTAVAITGNLRSGILSLLALFIIGGLILFTVNEKEGMEVAKGC